MKKRTCVKCGEEHDATTEFFYAQPLGKDGLRRDCVECNKAYKKEHSAKPEVKERRKITDAKWYEKNRDRSLQYSHDWYERNPDRRRENQKNLYNSKPEHFRKKQKEWRAENNGWAREREQKYLEDNPKFRLSNNISRNIRQSLGMGKNGHHWETLVGYTLDEYVAHLESQFTKGMTWGNYGKWHVDHVRPISDFNFESADDPEFKECYSLWNLQPLWAKDNLSKNNKCEAPPLPLLQGG